MVESRQAQLDLIFHALSDPTRRAILQTLTRRERSITEVAQPFGMSLAAVSKHVKVLERARLVHRERRGSFSYLRLGGDALLTAQQWIDKNRTLWDERLENLKNLLEKE
ncbi:MAG: metalloregulator ArsR/SmtB family transcription factor [Polyangiales bacterium]